MMLARKNNLKRVLSSFLAMVMLLGLLPTAAFATGWENQIVSNGEETTIEDGKVVHSKMIKQTGQDAFDITLTVKTLEEIQEQTVSQDAAVVLVLDVSNSMEDEVKGGQKLAQAKAAAKEFVDAFVKDAGEGSRMVSIVEFGSNAKTVSGWTQANGNADAVKNAINNIQIGFTCPDNQANVSFGIFGTWSCSNCGETGLGGGRNHTCYNDAGGTNIEGGLRLANNLLDSSAVSEIGNTYVVLLTDGVPTFHVDSDKETASTEYMAGSRGGGSYVTHDDYHDIYCTQKNQGRDHVQHGDNIPQQIKNKGAKLYTVAYDMAGNDYSQVNSMNAKQWLTAFSTQMISADTDIFEGLGQVAEIIVNQAKAWILTDPMGEFINFVPDEDSGVAVGTTADLAGSDAVLQFNTDTKTLTWDLKSDLIHREKQGSYWVYTFTYSITLDTANQEFDENKEGGYPTNGTTTLTYMLTDDEGVLQPDLESTNLVVPVVEGKTPMVDYTINYWYKDKESGEYKVGKTDSDSAKLWSKITIDSGAYSKENYRFNKGPTGEQTLTADGLVFDLYYDPILANVVVNHWVSTVDQTDDGDVYNTPVLRDTDPYPNLYKGDKFTNEEFLDGVTKVDSVTVGDTTYTTDNYTNITLPEGPTVINIYYTAKGDDERTPVDYEIHYWYREDSWQLNADGKYEKVTGTYAEDTSVLIQQKDYHGVTITAPAKAGEYTLDSDKTTATSMVLDKDKTNRLDVYYYKGAPDMPDAETATLTIKHVYKQETINGVVEVEADNWTEYDNQTVYVGETYAATPNTKDGYTLKTLAKDFTVTINEAGKHYEIEVEYYKDVREPVDIVMNHYYTTYTWTVDPVTGEGSYVLTGSDKLENVRATGTWYAGQTYTPNKISNGYTYVSGGDAAVLTSGTNTFNLCYETYVGSEDDEADVTVNHIYTTYRSYVDADGNVVLNEPSTETESEDTYYGMKGDTFTAVQQVKDDFTFVKADTDDLLVTLRGEGGQYNLYYEKYVNELGDSYAVTVQPIYKTYTTSVNDEGQVVTTLTNDEDGTPVTLDGDFYEGQKVTALAADYGKDGFTYAPADEENTAGLTITVSATGENVIYVVYSKTDSSSLGLPGVVLVNNVYTTVTKYIDANGELQTKENSITGSNTTYGPYYVGQFFDTTGKSTQREGYVLDTREGITQPTDSVKVERDGQQITFYWLQEVDETVPATVKVVHHYTLKDANPNVGTTSWNVGADSEPFTGYYAGQLYQAGYDFQNGTFAEEHVTEVVPGGAATAPGLKLVAGLNEIHIYYEKSVDSRVSTTVKVIHNYYADAEALAAGTTEATYEENPTKMEADSYTATLRTEHNGLLYTFDSATPEGYTIKVDKDASKNVITISYLRAETGYKVIHTYYTDNALTGSTERTATGTVGEVISAADLAKETAYGGNTYAYTSADKETLELVADAASNVITLRYDRTTPDPDYPPYEPDEDDEDEPVEIPEETTPLNPNPEPSEEPVEIPEETTPLNPAPEPSEEPVEIPEETTPLDPGTEIPEETTPLGDLPQTGAVAAPVNPATTASLVALAFSMVGCGLYFTFGRKKGEEED